MSFEGGFEEAFEGGGGGGGGPEILDADCQELYDHGRSSIPSFLFQLVTAPEDWIGGFVKIFCLARRQVATWQDYAFILDAPGIWLDQHARDRGTTRQANESDDALRSRLRTVQDAVNPASLLAAATAALLADGITIPSGYPYMVELRRDRMFFGTWDNPAPNPPGSNYDGRKMGYWQRGYRFTNGRGGIIIILPPGTPTATQKSVLEAARKKKAGGFSISVEVSPP